MLSHKTSAWPLALVYAGLIVYASLYPFEYWRDQGVQPWLFFVAPWPRYWTGFDVLSNVLGYMPLGFFLTLGSLRTGHLRWAIWVAVPVASALSLVMETLQVYLPDRVPSNLDLVLNILGATLGTLSAWGLEKLGALQRWSRFRANWFVQDARDALVLLALWPVALLFPTAIPFGLGQVMERLETGLAGLLSDSPFLAWLPVRDIELQPMLPMANWLAVLLGLMTPGLLGYCIIRQPGKRLWFLLWLATLGVAVTSLSATLSFGPEHAWVWLKPPVRGALMASLVVLAMLLWAPPRAAATLAVLALGIDLSLINQAPIDPYFEQTLFMWEQGRFIRFHGLAQWLGWLWPFVALWYVLSRAWGKAPAH
jgi:VanZ family protein